MHTTFLPELQDAAERAVATGLRADSNEPGLEAALVAIDPQNRRHARDGRRRDYRAQHVQPRDAQPAAARVGVQAARLRGGARARLLAGVGAVESAATSRRRAIRSGRRATPTASTPDALTLRAALIESNNAAAADLQQRDRHRAPVLRLAGDAGLRDLPDVPSLALGTGLVTPLELTAAYAMFPGGGAAGAAARHASACSTRDGDSGARQPVDTRARAVAAAVAFQMVTMLRDVVERGTGSAGARRSGVRGPVGGKTGTTDDYHDAWFVGFSTSVVVGVWVGFDQPATIGREAYGARVALPIWADFMKRTRPRAAAAASSPSARRASTPRNCAACRICGRSTSCPAYTEYFKDGDNVPSRLCPVHKGTLSSGRRARCRGSFAPSAES